MGVFNLITIHHHNFKLSFDIIQLIQQITMCKLTQQHILEYSMMLITQHFLKLLVQILIFIGIFSLVSLKLITQGHLTI